MMLIVSLVLLVLVVSVECKGTKDGCSGEDSNKICTPVYNCKLLYTRFITERLCGYDSLTKQPLVCCQSSGNSSEGPTKTMLLSPHTLYLIHSPHSKTKVKIFIKTFESLRYIDDLQLLRNKTIPVRFKIASVSRYKRAAEEAPFTSNPLLEREANVIPNPVALSVNTTVPPLELFTSPPLPVEANVIPAVIPLKTQSDKPDTSSIMNLYTSAPLPPKANTVGPPVDKPTAASTVPIKSKRPATKPSATKQSKKPERPTDTRPIVFEDSLPSSTTKSDLIYFPDKVPSLLHNKIGYEINALSVAVPQTTPQPKLEKILPNRYHCGIHRNAKRFTESPNANVDEFPWLALLRYIDDYNRDAGFRCTGSLISDRYVLTAAHCLTLNSLCVDSVRLGEWKVASAYDCSFYRGKTECIDKMMEIKVARKILHKGFDQDSWNNDIALLRLQTRVAFTDFIRPICLPVKHLRDPPLGTIYTTSGWGTTPFGYQLDIKSKINLPVIHRAYCKEYQYFKEQMCIGYLKRNDFGKMDAGGPVLALDSTDKPQWYLEGVMQRGYGSNLLSYPGAYTRLTYYIDWLIETILNDARR